MHGVPLHFELTLLAVLPVAHAELWFSRAEAELTISASSTGRTGIMRQLAKFMRVGVPRSCGIGCSKAHRRRDVGLGGKVCAKGGFHQC